ncbi:MAG: NAD(P)/FAD-dependent oxidoreductase [Candidatus Diapherotrites archaeon]
MRGVKNSYDVIVVGGGPGGLATAAKCAELGLSTILFEKDQEIGEPVRCGEGLGAGWFQRLDLQPDPCWAVQPITGAALYSPSGKRLVLDFKKTSGYVLERKIFEKFLAREAARKGAKIYCKSTVTDLIKEKEFVKGVKVQHFQEEIEVRANIVVAADGFESKIARMAGMQTTQTLYHVDSGFEYEMAGIDFGEENLIHLFFGNKIASRGYLWIFPKGKDYANVGIGIGANTQETAKYYLDAWIDSMPGLKKGSIIQVMAGGIPVGGFLEHHAVNGLIVVGDAAHQVNPIHGGGMGLAIEAGRLAAEVIKKAHEAKDFSQNFLFQFDPLWYEKRGNQLKSILKRRKMFEALSDNDFETLASSMSGEDVLKLAEGDLMQSIAIATKKLIMHPGLLKIILKYLKEK